MVWNNRIWLLVIIAVLLPTLAYAGDDGGFWDTLTMGLGTVLSAGTGGIFGLASSLISGWLKRKEKREEREWQKEKWKYEQDMIKLEMDVENNRTQNEIRKVHEAGRWDGLNAVYRAESVENAGVSRWVLNVQKLFRMFLCVMLNVMWFLVIYWLFNALMYQGDRSLVMIIGQADAVEIFKYSIYSLVFMASSAALFYYGERAFTPTALKSR